MSGLKRLVMFGEKNEIKEVSFCVCFVLFLFRPKKTCDERHEVESCDMDIQETGSGTI